MRHRSIRFRLTAWYAGTMFVTFAVAGVVLFFSVQRAAEATIDADLRARLAAVQEYLPADLSHANPAKFREDLEELSTTGAGGVWLQVADNAGRWLHRSDAIQDQAQAAPMARDLPAHGHAQTIAVRGAPFRILTAAASGGVVQLGMPVGQFTQLLDNLRVALLIACPAVLLLAGAGGYWMSGRALKPVDAIALTVERIGSENLAERLALRGTGDELDRLSGLLNQMLGRIEAAFRRVTQFTADASHELRTPVAILRTTGEVMQASPSGVQEHRVEWGHVVTQTERMSELIDDLLLLARTDAGRSGLAFEAMDLASVAREVTNEIAVLSTLRLTTVIPDVCAMQGAPGAIRRILMVLLDNAMQYTNPGGEITVRLRVAQDRAVVEVSDTGIGIPAADLPLIFDRFYRVSADRSRQTGGAGLGLSIARSLAVLYGGDIEVESVLDQGSTFRVTLPILS